MIPSVITVLTSDPFENRFLFALDDGQGLTELIDVVLLKDGQGRRREFTGTESARIVVARRAILAFRGHHLTNR
jgi:hypothetical protein